MPSTSEIGWCAGLFDGEGCITGTTNGRYGFRVELRVNMCDYGGVTRFARLIGRGSVHRQPARGIRKVSWVWRTSGRADTRCVLDLLRPHLVVKAREADLALEFLRTENRDWQGLLCVALRACKSKPGPGRRVA